MGERQSDGYESPSLPKRAETFGGFDAADGRTRRKSENGWSETAPPLLGLDKQQQAAAAQGWKFMSCSHIVKSWVNKQAGS